MTIVEKSSNRKKLAILELVRNGEYSIAYALNKVEDLHDSNKLTDTDYEELATYLEDLITVEEVEETEEIAEENIVEEE